MDELGVFALLTALTSLPAVALVRSVVAANAAPGAEPDPLVGMRTRATTSSARAWVAGHRAALGPVRAATTTSAVCTAAGASAALVSTAVDAAALPAAVLAVAGCTTLVAGSGWGCVVADRAARVVRDGGAPDGADDGR